MTTGIEGKWLMISLSGQNIEPGFYLLTVIETESLSGKTCMEGSINLQKGVISDPQVGIFKL